MSGETVDLLLGWYERYWSKGDFFGSLEAWDRDVEVRLSTEFLEPMIGRGLEDLAQLMRTWLGAWDDYRVFPDEYIEVSEGRVVVFQREEGTGRGSDIPMESRNICIYTIQNRKIVRFEVYRDIPRELKAAGPSE